MSESTQQLPEIYFTPLSESSPHLRVLLNSLHAGNLNIFVGSAISGYRPSCLPAGSIFSQTFRDLLTETSSCKAVPNVAFETLLWHGVSTLGEPKIHELLTRLYGRDDSKPNDIHRLLAYLMKLSASVITPNFDNLIEEAVVGRSASKNYEQSFFQEHLTRISSLSSADLIPTGRESTESNRPILYKIHGSIEEPHTLIYQINQEGRLEEIRKRILKELCSHRDLLVVGYSGADWDILPALSEVSLGQVFWNSWTPTDLTSSAEKFLQDCSSSHVLIGDMLQLFMDLDPSGNFRQSALDKKSCNPKKRILNSFSHLDEEELRHWHGALLGRCGYGEAALVVLESVGESYSRLLQQSEAAFYAGLYEQAQGFAERAMSLASTDEGCRFEAALLISNALRQQGRHLKQLLLLLKIRSEAPENSQPYGSALTYLSQNPLLPRGLRRGFIKDAKAIRQTEPWSSMLLLNSVARTKLKLETGEDLAGQNPQAWEDLLTDAKRLGHATEIVNSLRDISRTALTEHRQAGQHEHLSAAEQSIQASLSHAERCGDRPGIAKAHTLRAEIRRRRADPAWLESLELAIGTWQRVEIPRVLLPIQAMLWHITLATKGRAFFSKAVTALLRGIHFIYLWTQITKNFSDDSSS